MALVKSCSVHCTGSSKLLLMYSTSISGEDVNTEQGMFSFISFCLLCLLGVEQIVSYIGMDVLEAVTSVDLNLLCSAYILGVVEAAATSVR